jgi:hypothetical protein
MNLGSRLVHTVWIPLWSNPRLPTWASATNSSKVTWRTMNVTTSWNVATSCRNMLSDLLVGVVVVGTVVVMIPLRGLAVLLHLASLPIRLVLKHSNPTSSKFLVSPVANPRISQCSRRSFRSEERRPELRSLREQRVSRPCPRERRRDGR